MTRRFIRLAVMTYELGMKAYARGDYARAQSYYEQVLLIFEKENDLENIDLIPILSSIGELHFVQYNIEDGQLIYKRLFEIYEKTTDHQDIYTALYLRALGNMRQFQDDFAGARPLYERALEVSEKALGLEDPNTVSCLIELGNVLRTQGDFTGARSLYERALTICESKIDSQDHYMVLCLTGFGNLLRDTDDFAGAQTFYERVLTLYDKILGPESKHSVFIIRSIGDSLQEQGDLAGARSIYERALVTCEKAFGPESKNAILILRNLGALLHNQGDLAGARPLYEHALAICKKVFGPGHLQTNIIRFKLAETCFENQDYIRCFEYISESISSKDRDFGSNNFLWKYFCELAYLILKSYFSKKTFLSRKLYSGIRKRNVINITSDTRDPENDLQQNDRGNEYLLTDAKKLLDAYLKAKNVSESQCAAVAAQIELLADRSAKNRILPKKAPERYDARTKRPELGRKEKIGEFMIRVWGQFMSPNVGPLTRKALRDLDDSADAGVENWLSYHKALPEGVYLPTLPELNDAALAGENVKELRRRVSAANRRRPPQP